MRICHVTPHLPPDQAANALLPFHLGQWAVEAGHEVRYVAHPSRSSGWARQPGPVTWIPSRRRGPGWLRATKLPSAHETWRILSKAGPVIGGCDLVHVHSNGLLAELSAWVARVRRKPVVLTLYGTEIWHYRQRRGLDLFTRMVRGATGVVFYSRQLLDRARQHGFARDGMTVIYPSVSNEFRPVAPERVCSLRRDLAVTEANLVINVKRLHPLAGQRTLIQAMPHVLAAHPSTRLVICGAGPLRAELEALALRCGIAPAVTFTGLLDNARVARYCAAADLFALPSRLEACPTVALEALAAGTPVISTDNPGGLELQALFGADVTVVPREDPIALARALSSGLTNKRRTAPETAEVLSREFRPDVVWARYQTVYGRAVPTEPFGGVERLSQ